ncbi:reverse transcriptase domain-containing protein [Tanacetum coccineum]
MPPRRSSATARAAAAAAATPMTAAAVEQLIKARVSAALANHETLRNSTNGQGDGSHNSDTGIRGTVRTPRECTYKDFLNCKPLSFKGTEGVVVLSQWFEKMESVFHISNCAVENQVKFATCTFLGNALTWWNSHMKTVTQDVAYAMDWKALKKMMTESDEVEKYVGGLPDMIRGNVMSYQPKTMEKAIEFANDQMDQKVLTIAERQAEQKRKLEFNAGNNQGHQQQNKRQNTGIRGTVRTPRECTYKDFLNCKPLSFKGTEGVVVLSQWFEKMESVFHISNCAVENQVKFATCTFLGNALTWWNSYMKTVTQDVAYAMDWKALKKMMTVKYCPRGEIKKLEIKLWNLKVKGTDVASYTLRFQELALMCGRMFHEESDEVEKYVGGLPDMIRGNVMSYQPKTMEKAIEFANDQMDQKVLTIAERQANTNLMPVELGSFDVIVGMDWLAKYHVVIDCAEKIVRIP